MQAKKGIVDNKFYKDNTFLLWLHSSLICNCQGLNIFVSISIEFTLCLLLNGFFHFFCHCHMRQQQFSLPVLSCVINGKKLKKGFIELLTQFESQNKNNNNNNNNKPHSAEEENTKIGKAKLKTKCKQKSLPPKLAHTIIMR